MFSSELEWVNISKVTGPPHFPKPLNNVPLTNISAKKGRQNRG